MTLAKRHADWLNEHGISPAFARKVGIFTAEKPSDLPEGFQAGIGRYLPACVFPWTSPDGRVELQIHPDAPPTDESGRARKYAFRSRKAGFETLLWQLRAAGDTALLVEGTKQSVAAANWAPDEFAVYGIAGVRMWQQDSGVPIRDLAALRSHSSVVILLDGDAKSNQQVFDAGADLREALLAEGVEQVVFARMPGGDLDDWLSDKPESDRGEMLGRLARHAKTKPADRRPKSRANSKPEGVKILPDPANPIAVARVLEPEYRRGEARTLVNWQDAWYRWDEVSWAESNGVKPEMWLKTEGAIYATETPRGTEYLEWAPTINKVSNLVAALESVLHLDDRISPPTWIDGASDPGVAIALRNGLLTIHDRHLHKHDPRYFNLVGLPFEYDKDAECPNWLEFLGSLWTDDELSAASLQEWFGYVVSGRTDMHKIFSIIGPPRSGKGTIAGILEELVGAANVAGPTMASFASNFGIQPLLGKSLAVIGDARIPGQHRDAVVEKLLTISGQDKITVDRKYLSAWYGSVPTRLMILSNEPLRFIDMSGAIATRFIALQTIRSFVDNPDVGLRARLTPELPGILNWALDGYDRLDENGRFTIPEYMTETLRDMRHTASPVTEFVDDECVVGPDYEIESERLWQTWNQWCLRQGRERTGTQAYFGRDLNAVVPGLHKKRGRVGGHDTGKRVMVYIGITLRDDIPEGRVIVQDDAPTTQIPDDASANAFNAVKLNGPGSPSETAGVTMGSHRTDVRSTPSDLGGDIVGHSGHSEEKNPQHGEKVLEEGEKNNIVPSEKDNVIVTMTRMTHPDEPRPGLRARELARAYPTVLDLETASADELYRRTEGFIRLFGWKTDDGVEIETELVARAIGLLSGHNIVAFDLPALAQHQGIPFEVIHRMARQGELFDTLLAARQDDPPMAREKGVDFSRRYDLDSLASKHGIGHKSDQLKALAKEFGGFDQIPLDDSRYRDYLRQDLELSWEMMGVYREYINVPYVQREHRVAAIAAQIRHNGFRVDTELLAGKVTEVESRKSKALRYLNLKHGVPLVDIKGNPSKSPLSTKGGRQAVVDALTSLGVKSFWTTGKTKAVALNGEAMRHLAAQHAENQEVVRLARAVAIVTGSRAIHSTIQENLIGDRVHPEISLRQASGRWTYTGINLAALGKQGQRYHERDVFLPEPGHLILAVDLSQVDMRAVAGLCGDPAYVELFRSGGDVHTQVAIQLFGDASYRQLAKQIGHGWNYGEANRTIAERYEIEPAKVLKFDRSMRERFPLLVQWQTDARARAESGELLDNGFGRKMRPDPHRAWTQGPALEGQGAARDIMMQGLLRLPPEILPLLRAQVHDEIVLSVPEADYQDVKQIVLDALQFEWDSPGGLSVPIAADASPPGRCWGEVYAKD